MEKQIKVLVRMRDVIIALHVAKKYNVRLNKIQLQKLIYLLDVLSPYYNMYYPREGHITYKLGPYDLDIQNAADSLAFRELVKVVKIKRISNESIAAAYELSSSGLSLIKKLKKIKVFKARWLAAMDIGKHINRLGWNRLKDLVYAEPTFTNAKARGRGQRLNPNDGLNNTTSYVMSTIENVLLQGTSKDRLDSEIIVDLFFRYLDLYDKKINIIY